MTTKKCTQCAVVKPLTEFYREGKTSQCKKCDNARNLAWRTRNPERVKEWDKAYYAKNSEKIKAYVAQWNRDNAEVYRARKMQQRYGITPAQYDAILQVQNGTCAICYRVETRGRGVLHIDHCHATGAVRGLLCFDCNTMLGKVKDVPETLDRAAQYLRRAQNMHKEIQ